MIRQCEPSRQALEDLALCPSARLPGQTLDQVQRRGDDLARAHLLDERGHERHATIGAQRGGEQPSGQLAIGRRVERAEPEGALDLAEVLASCFVAVLCIVPHHRRVELQLRGDVGQDRRRDLLVGAERPAGEPQIAELDSEAETIVGSPALHDSGHLVRR